MAKASNIAIADALLRQFRAGVEPGKIAEGLAAYLIEERRIGDKNAILRDVERQIYNLESTLYVRTASASELTTELNQKISEIFSKSTEAEKVIISSEINQDVIGGVRCQTTDLVLDLTIRRQLQQLKGAITVN
ncbi:ATP synthase F1 subunit delta [Candidatus Saccharibacteria bacterium]|nr:ATP synthase F1 subunit delta [Candidatus Saccharibacteria bacterium]